jgi:tetratricopeptide (TPR) repeat protein/adenylate kinase family enzyme
MQKLIEKGYVQKKTVHVRGTIKRRVVYYLTNDGIKAARTMETSIQETLVLLKTSESDAQTVRLAEVSGYVPEKTTLLSIFLHVSEEGIFDCETFQKMSVDKEEGYIDYAVNLPKLKYFFDRKKELKNISKWLRTDSFQVMVIYGIAGCGKTTLATKVIENAKAKMNVFWYQFHEWDTMGNVLAALSKYLNQLGRKDLRTYLKVSKEVDMNGVSEILRAQLKDVKTLLVFDDFHKASDQIVTFFLAFREMLESLDKVKMMVIGRNIKPFYDSREIVVKKMVTEMQLGGLDKEGSRQLLEQRNIKDFESLHRLTEGHPLFLELMESPDDMKRDSVPTRFIHEQIFSKLADDEKSVLKFMSVFRYPVSPEVLFIEPSVDYETLRRLKLKSLIYEVYPDQYVIHDLIKEFFLGTMKPQVRERHHRTAAQHYMKGEDGFSGIETQYHLTSAGDHAQAAMMAIEQGPVLIRNGHLDQFLNVLFEFDENRIDEEQLISIIMLRGDILVMKGRLDDALECYTEAQTLNDKVKAHGKEIEILMKIGRLCEKRGELREALDYHEQVLKLSKNLNNPRGMANAYMGLGRVHNELGNLDTAVEEYGRSLELLEPLGPEPEVAEIHSLLGQIHAENGQSNEALEHFERCIDISEKMDQPYLKGLTAFLAAASYSGLAFNGDGGVSIDGHETFVEISRKMGYERGMAYGLANASKGYAKKLDFDKALEYLERVLETSKKLDAKLLSSLAYTSFGTIYRLKKDWNKSLEYLQTGIKILEGLKVPGHLGDAYFEAALAFKDRGDNREADSYLKRALKIHEKAGAAAKVESMRQTFGQI